VYTDRHFSPFEGGWGDVNNKKLQKTLSSHLLPLNEVRELAQRSMFYLKERSMCTLGMLIIRYAKVIKKYQSAKKNRLPFLGAVSIVKKYRRIDNLKLLR